MVDPLNDPRRPHQGRPEAAEELFGGTGAEGIRKRELLREMNRRGRLTPEQSALVGEYERRGLFGPQIPEPQVPEESRVGPIEGAGLRLQRAITGRGDYSEDLPDISGVVAARMRETPMKDRFGLASLEHAITIPATTEGKINAIRRADPEARFSVDAMGNPIVEAMGMRGYLNRPGLSRADLDEALVLGVTEGPLIAGGALLGGPGGAAGRVAGAATGGAGGSVLRDLAAKHLVGSGEEVDYGRAATAGAFAGGLEGLGLTAGTLLRRIFNNPRLMRGGELTAEGRQILESAGIDPSSLPPEILEQMRGGMTQAQARGATPAEAAAIAQAQTLPEPIPLSRGQVTRETGAIGEERAALAGARGPEAEAAAQQFFARQNEAVQANIPALQARVGGAGTPQVLEPGEGMRRIQARLQADKEARTKAMGAAFREAREGTGLARIPGPVAAQGTRSLKRNVAGDFDPINAPKAFRLLEGFQGFTSRRGLRELDVRAVETFRRRLSKLSRDAKGTEDGAAASAMIRNLDQQVDGFVKQGLIRGEVDVVAKWQKARGMRAEIGRMFEDNALVDTIIRAETPQEALSVLFTAQGAGAKKGAVGAAKQLRELLPPAEFNLLKEEAFLRLLRSQAGGRSYVPGDPGMAQFFSGAKFKTALDQAMRDSPDLMNALFSVREIGQLMQFGHVAERISNLPPGAVSSAGTSEALMRNLNRTLEGFGFLGRLAKDIATASTKGLRQAGGARQAREAFSPMGQIRPRQNPVPPGLVGTGGAVGYGLQEEQ